MKREVGDGANEEQVRMARSADRADAAITADDLLTHLLTSSNPTALISVRAILAASDDAEQLDVDLALGYLCRRRGAEQLVRSLVH